MKLTDTNRPRACHTTHASHKDPCPASTMRYPKTHTTQQNKTINLCHEPVPVAIARGKHPDPSRTRKLSLPALMVLHTQVCGRVRRRRTHNHHMPPHTPNVSGGTTTPTQKHTDVSVPQGLVSWSIPCKLEARVTDPGLHTGKGALSMERMSSLGGGGTSNVSCPGRVLGKEGR